MTPKDNSLLTLRVYSDWLEEHSQIELAEKIREEINTIGLPDWVYESWNTQVGGLNDIIAVGAGLGLVVGCFRQVGCLNQQVGTVAMGNYGNGVGGDNADAT